MSEFSPYSQYINSFLDLEGSPTDNGLTIETAGTDPIVDETSIYGPGPVLSPFLANDMDQTAPVNTSPTLGQLDTAEFGELMEPCHGPVDLDAEASIFFEGSGAEFPPAMTSSDSLFWQDNPAPTFDNYTLEQSGYSDPQGAIGTSYHGYGPVEPFSNEQGNVANEQDAFTQQFPAANLQEPVNYGLGVELMTSGASLHPTVSATPLDYQSTYNPHTAYSQPTQFHSGSRSPRSNHKVFPAEKPEKDLEHDWVRINGSTAGKSTRTGKINKYNASKVYSPTIHPIGSWMSSRTERMFEYTRNGELSELTFTPEEIESFLFDRPPQFRNQLTIWIQKTPADSGRRYPTMGSDKCRFADCPQGAIKGQRTIAVGSFRVAFDEQWAIHHDQRDPFFVAGYAHLYCLERFCDFPSICKLLKVRPDVRYLKDEPRGQWGASVGEDVVKKRATEFIDLCRNDSLATTYPEYPFIHPRKLTGAEFEFDHTLTKALNVAKLEETSHSKKAMMEERGLTNSNVLVHKGDLQMYVDAKQAMSRTRKRALGKLKDRQGRRAAKKGGSQNGDGDSSSELSDAAPDSDEDFTMTQPSRQWPKKRKTSQKVTKKRSIEISDEEDNETDHVSARSAPKKTRLIEVIDEEEENNNSTASEPLKPRKTVRFADLPSIDTSVGEAAKVAHSQPQTRRGALADSLYGFDA